MKTKIDIEYLRKNNLILLECISGSRAFNLHGPQSDTDIKGVFYLPKDIYLGFDYIPQVANETNDIVFYEIGRFLELLAKNNPNILELLATPKSKILYKHPILNQLTVELFLSLKCKDTFAGYALGQIKKARGLNKKIVNPVDKEKKTILNFCYVAEDQGSCSFKSWIEKNQLNESKIGLVKVPHFKDTYGIYYDESSGDFKGVMTKKEATSLLLSSVPKGLSHIAYLHFNQDGFKTYCKDYREYWEWVENRNESRFVKNKEHNRNYDSKNMMHTFRLLNMAEEILKEGKIYVERQDREELLAIKDGKYSYEDLIAKADAKMLSIHTAASSSKLAATPSVSEIEKKLIRIREELYGL